MAWDISKRALIKIKARNRPAQKNKPAPAEQNEKELTPTEDIVEGALLLDVLTLLANNNRKLTLIIRLIILRNRRNNHRLERILEGRCRLHEQNRVLRDRHLGLLRVLCIIKTDTTKDWDIGKGGEQLCNRDDGLGDRGGRGGIDVARNDFGGEGSLVSGGGF